MAQNLGTPVIQAAEAKKSMVVDYCLTTVFQKPQILRK